MAGEAINKPVLNADSRPMQPLPWREEKQEGIVNASHITSANNKQVATFWGNDDRHPQNFEWCTTAQREKHVAYTIHCCNSFPHIQAELEKIYGMEDMPEEAVKAIEALMEKIYYEEVPVHV